MKKIILSILVFIGAQAHANQQIKAGPPTDSTANSYSFAELKQSYANSVTAKGAAFEGSWRLIAYASSKMCGGDQLFDLGGLQNSDKTVKEFEFVRTFKPNAPGAPANFPKEMITVKVFNFQEAKFKQGPFDVSGDEPQFAHWANAKTWEDGKHSSKMSYDGYFQYSCRISSDSKFLVCAVKNKLVTDRWSADTKACATDIDFSSFEVYARK